MYIVEQCLKQQNQNIWLKFSYKYILFLFRKRCDIEISCFTHFLWQIYTLFYFKEFSQTFACKEMNYWVKIYLLLFAEVDVQYLNSKIILRHILHNIEKVKWQKWRLSLTFLFLLSLLNIQHECLSCGGDLLYCKYERTLLTLVFTFIISTLDDHLQQYFC